MADNFGLKIGIEGEKEFSYLKTQQIKWRSTKGCHDAAVYR